MASTGCTPRLVTLEHSIVSNICTKLCAMLVLVEPQLDSLLRKSIIAEGCCDSLTTTQLHVGQESCNTPSDHLSNGWVCAGSTSGQSHSIFHGTAHQGWLGHTGSSIVTVAFSLLIFANRRGIKGNGGLSQMF